MAVSLLLDLSNWQGTVNYDLLAGAPAYLNGVHVGNVEGVIAKATEGTWYVDPYFERNWREAARVGLARGAYHFIRADLGTDPAEESEYFWQAVAAHLDTGDNLLLDVEDFPERHNPPDLDPWVTTFMQHLEGRCGYPPGIYSTASYLSGHNLANKPHLANYGLWLASWYGYPSADDWPAPPPDWPVAYLWQFTSSGMVAGVGGHVDMNYCGGTIDLFRAYGKPGGPAAPPPPREYLDAVYSAQLACRPVYTTPADQDNLDQIVGQIDFIKHRYAYDP